MALRKAVILLIEDSEIDRTLYGRYLRDCYLWKEVAGSARLREAVLTALRVGALAVAPSPS
ncbi:hypothetical protein [Sorangium sp. So ce362]|uniref:hypothetical protein n=1 Tax=Sorangium sp. So ce362 TaxID=3133303 RepID=UPI003F6345D1